MEPFFPEADPLGPGPHARRVIIGNHHTRIFELPVFLKLTNTEPFAAWFVETGDATPDGIRKQEASPRVSGRAKRGELMLPSASTPSFVFVYDIRIRFILGDIRLWVGSSNSHLLFSCALPDVVC